MKTVLLRLFAVLFVSFNVSVSSAQLVTIPDGNFLIFLQNSDVDSCLVGNQLDGSCPAVLEKTILDCHSMGIYDLTGLEAFVSVETLYCYNNHLTTLPDLPAGLTYLACHDNQLTSLPSLPNGIKTFGCGGNQLVTLPSLPDSLTWFSCKDNNLISLPALPAGLDLLYCYQNQLTSLPALPDSLTSLYCYQNQITSLPALPSKLKWLDLGHNQVSVLPDLPSTLYHLQCQTNLLTALPDLPEGLNSLSCCCQQIADLPTLPSSLTFLFCSGNPLGDLPALPDSLTYLACSNTQLTVLPPLPSTIMTLMCGWNQLTEIPPLPSVMDLLNIENNPGITCLPPLEKITGNVWGWTSSIGNTGITCLPNIIQHPNSIPSIDTLPVCGIFNPNSCPVSWNVSGKLFRDDDSDCQNDFTEPRLQNIKMLLKQSGNLLQQVYTNIDGRYSFDTNLGTFTTHVDTVGIPFVICPVNNSHTSILTTADSLDYTSDFALQCKPGYNLAVQSIVHDYGVFFPAQYAHVRIDAGDLAHYYGVSCNTQGVGGTVTATVNGPVTIASTNGGSLSGNTITWTVSDFSTLDFFNDFGISFYTDTFPATTQLCISVTINPSSGTDYNPANNTRTQCFAVTNSFDPNFKEVYPTNTEQPGAWHTYTIHFQNTGTAPAINIQLKDTLDANLDWSSFQLLAYSHDNFTQVLPNGIVHFSFPNIYLPDSTSDEEGSHGWIQYRIKTKSTITPGTVIHNTASIYFDFNAPVVTNDAGVQFCQPTTVSQNVSLCNGDSLQVGTHWYHQAGLFTDSLQNMYGCDSVVITTIAVNSVAASASVQDSTLSTVSPGTAYQWYTCADNQPITGATSSTYTATANGLYKVMITGPSGCSAFSPCVAVTSFTPLGGCAAVTNVSVSNVTSNLATVSWTGNAGAVKYRIRLKNMATGSVMIKFALSPNETIALTALQPNTLYQVRIRTQCSANGSVLSSFTAPVYFTTNGASAPSCVPPTGITATPTSSTSATITWSTVSGANGYQIRYRMSGSSIWIPVVLNSGGANTYTLTGLTSNATYEFQMRTKCSTSPLTWSSFSSLQTFNTPMRLSDAETVEQLIIYPNPASNTATLSFNAMHESVATLEIFSIDGRLLHNGSFKIHSGTNKTTVDVNDFSSGIYMVKLHTDEIHYRKLIVQH